MGDAAAPLPDNVWRQALAVRGLVSRKIRAALDAADDGRIELGAPSGQPFRRDFVRLVNLEAARKWGAGNYRMQSLNDPARIAVWRGPSVSGVPDGAGMSRGSMAWLRAYTERRLPHHIHPLPLGVGDST